MHELILFNSNGTKKNITSMVGALSWTSNEDALGVQLDFDLASNNIVYFPKDVLDIGNIVILRNNNNEVFRGIIITEDILGEFTRHYTAFDYAFYLNKSKGVYQFNNIQASKAIVQLLSEYNVPIGNIRNIPTLIDFIYYDKVISDIIRDILQKSTVETGIKYRMEMRQGKLYIEKQTDLVIEASFLLGDKLLNITEAISNPTRRRSIEEMKNSIVITVKSGDSEVITGHAKDDQSISRYGLLQEVQSIDKKNIAQANNIAQKLLSDLNKIFEDNSINCVGNDEVRAGRILNIVEPVTGMNGQYRIKSCVHNVNNGIHTMSLDLGVM